MTIDCRASVSSPVIALWTLKRVMGVKMRWLSAGRSNIARQTLNWF